MSKPDDRVLSFDTPLPGDRVTIADGIEGIVTGVCVRDARSLTVEVTWWDGRSRTVAWFSPYELASGRAPGKIGFATNA